MPISPRSANTDRFRPHLALVTVQILFGTWPIFGKIALRSISSTSLVGIRILGAAIIFTLLQRKLTQLRNLPGRVLAWILLTSVLGVVLNQLLFVKGLSLTTVINVTLLSTTIPVSTLIFSIVLGHERASVRSIAGIGLAAAGVVYLVDPFRANFSAGSTLGNLLVITSASCYGAYIAASRGLVRKYGALDLITWIFVMGAVVTLPIAAYSWSFVRWESVSIGSWAAIAYVLLVPTVGAYYLNAWALRRLAPSVVAIYIYLQPLIAFGLAPAILGERLSSRTLIACVLIFSGVALVTLRRLSAVRAEVSEQPDLPAH